MEDALRSRLLSMHYNDIINSCQSGWIKVCDDPTFWLDKIKFELDYYNVPFYDLYEFLREALEMRQFKYFKAILINQKSIPDDSRIHRLLFQYGYLTDNIDIMMKFAETQQR